MENESTTKGFSRVILMVIVFTAFIAVAFLFMFIPDRTEAVFNNSDSISQY